MADVIQIRTIMNGKESIKQIAPKEIKRIRYEEGAGKRLRDLLRENEGQGLFERIYPRPLWAGK